MRLSLLIGVLSFFSHAEVRSAPKSVLDLSVTPKANETVIWTPGFQACWDGLENAVGAKFQRVEPPNKVIQGLANFEWDEVSVIPKNGFRFFVGPANREFETEVRNQLGRNLDLLGPYRDGPLPENMGNPLLILSSLERGLKFQEALIPHTKMALSFFPEDGKRPAHVASFGMAGEISENYRQSLRCIFYETKPKPEFAVQLKTKSPDETLILWRSSEDLSFAAAIEKASGWKNRVDLPGAGPLDARDRLVIPYLDLAATTDLAKQTGGKLFFEGAIYPKVILRAHEQIRFQINEQGADLETKTFMVAADFLATGPEQKKEPQVEPGRNLSFNRPFWVFLWRDKAAYPYFAARIGDPASLVPFRKNQ